MKTVELDDARGALADYVRELSSGPVVLTIGGKPVAALMAIDNADLETVTLSTNPAFLALIERSRARQSAEGGTLAEAMRRRLGL